MSINWDSIMAKAQKHMESPTMQREVQKKTDSYMLDAKNTWSADSPNVTDAGYKFANTLLHAIYREGFMQNLEADLENIEVGLPFKSSDGRYHIYVYFENDLDRTSMSTKKNYYDINLANLYNDGVDHVMKRIFEYDEFGGLHISNNRIPATYFMEQAVEDFMGNYASDYNVIGIKINTN